MSDDLAAAFNEQITMELASAIAYLQMAAYFENENLVGMAAWMRLQAEEENQHAHRFMDFVLDRGNAVSIGAIPAPRGDFDTPASVFEASLNQERAVSEAIHNLYRLASDADDLASFPLLQWFIDEQNEEEATVDTILERLKLAGSDSSSLLWLDSELGGRTASDE